MTEVPLLNRVLARVLDDLAWPFFSALAVLPWLGIRNPTWLIRVVVVIGGPPMRAALWLRGWRRPHGVSGS